MTFRYVVDGHAPLRHKLFQITQAQAEAQIPSYAGHDYLRLELVLPERWRPRGVYGATYQSRRRNTSLATIVAEAVGADIRPIPEIA